MKKLVFLLLFAGVIFAQDKPARNKVTAVGTATSWAAVFVGTGTGTYKDLSIRNLDSDTDTLIYVTMVSDTAAARWRFRGLVLAGEVDNQITRFGGDSLYVMSSSSTPYIIRSVVR